MTFRELLDKYRAGQASEEERAMVEAELEKSEAIADYLAEQVEDALGAAETQAPAGEVRHIQKKVNRRLRRTAVWAACIVLAVLLGRFVVGPWCPSLYYQPNAYTVGGMEDRAPASLVKENGVEVIRIGDLPPEEVERHLRVESQDVAVDLTALYSLLAPGATVTAASAQPEGFGRYTLTVGDGRRGSPGRRASGAASWAPMQTDSGGTPVRGGVFWRLWSRRRAGASVINWNSAATPRTTCASCPAPPMWRRGCIFRSI